MRLFLILLFSVSAFSQDGHFDNVTVDSHLYVNGAYVYVLDVTSNITADVLTVNRRIQSNEAIWAPKIYGTQEILAPEFSNNGGQMNFRAGSGFFSVANGYVEFFVGSPIQQGSTWTPSIKFSAENGTQFIGPVSFLNNSGSGPGAIDICTGLGIGGTCDVKEYSSDSVGQLWLTAGNDAASVGEMRVAFTQQHKASPICTVTLLDLGAPWAEGATVKQISAGSALYIRWSNNGQPLAYGGGGPGQALTYHCFEQAGEPPQ